MPRRPSLIKQLTRWTAEAPDGFLPKPKVAVEGPGGVQASFDFRVQQVTRSWIANHADGR